jgi:hypothetical protein
MYEGFSTIGSLVSTYEGFQGTENATCLNGQNVGNMTFETYVNTCLKDGDRTKLNTLFNEFGDKIGLTYNAAWREFSALMATYDGINTFKTNTNSTTTDADATLVTLNKKKEELKEELKRYRSEAEAKNQSFLDSILQGTPKETLTPTLQDATLLLFWFGWILLGVTLIFVRWFSPGGGWKSGLFATLLLLLVTLCLYAVLQKVA